MAVSVVAGVQLMVYLLSLPVYFTFRADNLRIRARLSAFQPSRPRRITAVKPANASKSPLLRSVWHFLRALRPTRIALQGTLRLPDAALTALACGGLCAAARGLSVRAEKSRIDIRPDFASDAVRIVLCGMVSARVGQIMLALLSVGYDDVKGRLLSWTSTRLKTS